MSTNVEPTVTAQTEIKSEAQTVLEDTTIVSDKTFLKLMGAVDTHQLKVGGKWSDLIQHCIDTYHFRGVSEEEKGNKEAVAANQKEVAQGKRIVLKTLLEMGKTESSAYSIRSYIVKMSRPDMAENLAKLKAGDITVRASREAGRKAQTSPSRSNDERYRTFLNDAARYGSALSKTQSQFLADAEKAWAEYSEKIELRKTESKS
jgi:hypothetical protein